METGATMETADASPLPLPQAPPIGETDTANRSSSDLSENQISAAEVTDNTHTMPQRDDANVVDLTTETTMQVNGNTKSTEHVVEILHELTTSVGINAELQCTLCHEVLCKPVTIPCGHSFCRICLIKYLLSKELDETQCPICRGLVLHTSVDDGNHGDLPAPTFCINVTLWNLIQLLVPAPKDKSSGEEEAEYALKYDQFDAKWRIAALHQSAGNRNERRQPWTHDDDIDSSGDELIAGHDNGSDLDEEARNAVEEMRRGRYPELRQENTIDGHLEVFRNVILDRDDANEDGYEGMRVGLAVMEFPSLFQPFNEHQECSIAVLKCEEDEDMDTGMPFFTSDDGDDDGLIISDFYNEIRLRVTDNAGNVVMERIRGCTQGIATFPNLRLDVPAGMYAFQFKDDLYGLRLTVRTEVRDLRDEDASSEIGNGRAVRLVLDQAGERFRSRRRRHFSDDEDDEVGDESGSDDSFIVNDDEDEFDNDNDHTAHFSGDNESEAAWSNPDEGDEEALMERQERLLRNQRAQTSDNDAESSNQDENQSDSDGRNDVHDAGVGSGPDDDEDFPSSVPSGRSVKRNRIVDDDDSESDESSAENQGQSGPWNPPGTNVSGAQVGRKRTRAILESEDEHTNDADEESKSDSGEQEVTRTVFAETSHGFSSNKRLRQITSRMFHDEDNDEESDMNHQGSDNDFGDEDEANAQQSGSQQSRWTGIDPYWTRRSVVSTSGVRSDDDDGLLCEIRRGRVGVEFNENEDFDDDQREGERHQENEQFQSEDEDDAWNSGYTLEHHFDEDECSE